MNEENERYQYSYSSKEQEEIRKIREKYIPKEEDKLQQLRRLDAEAAKPGTRTAVIIGVIGCMLLGFGMCCSLVWADTLFIPGVIVGALGIAAMGAACPICKRITVKERAKIAPEILRLTDELSKE